MSHFGCQNAKPDCVIKKSANVKNMELHKFTQCILKKIVSTGALIESTL